MCATQPDKAFDTPNAYHKEISLLKNDLFLTCSNEKGKSTYSRFGISKPCHDRIHRNIPLKVRA